MCSCNSTIILETFNLCRGVAKNGSTVKIVDDITFRFNKGRIFCVVGPSGAGKSSFLRLLNRLDEPTGGEVHYNNKAITSYEPTELRKKVALLFQEPYLFPGTIQDNLNYGCDSGNIENIKFHLERVGLKQNMADSDSENLSVGEKQRVALARSLILEPEILLLDEPTSALDPATSKKIEELIISLSGELCLTVIIVTHSPELALRLGGQTLLLVNGQLIESGDTAEVLTAPKTDQGKRYINRELV